jgi:hypothetical protein
MKPVEFRTVEKVVRDENDVSRIQYLENEVKQAN